MWIEVLGKSNSWPDAGGASSGYLVGEGADQVRGDVQQLGEGPLGGRPESDRSFADREYRLLLDCGHGVFAKLRERQDPAAIDAILISHLHADHCLDLVPYSQYLRHGLGGGEAERGGRVAGGCGIGSQHGLGDSEAGPRDPARLPVYGPPGLRAFVAKLCEAGVGDAIEAAFELYEYDPTTTLTLGPLTASFQLVPHFIETYAIRLRSTDCDLTYGADCRFNQALIDFARDTDLLIAEATLGVSSGSAEIADDMDDAGASGHMAATQAGVTGRQAGARRLLVTHFSDQLDRALLRAGAEAGFGALVEIACEGLQLSLSSSAPVTDNLSPESKPPTGATMFKGKTEDEAEVTEVAEEPVATKGGSPVKGVLALILLLLIGAGVALGVSKPLREKALDKLFGAEEQFDYTPPADPAADGTVPAADASTEPTV